MKRFLPGLILSISLLVATLACGIPTPTPTPPPTATEIVYFSKPARPYENESFSFTIPADWGTMEEVWEYVSTPGADYYGLGVGEIISIQYPAYQGQGDAFFGVASSPLADGETLESRFKQAYENPLPEIKGVIQQTFELGALSGLEISYDRPWGEPWWHFRDLWLEKDGSVYVLSCQTYYTRFDNYKTTFDTILNSFQFNGE